MQQLVPLAVAPRAAIVAPCANVATRHCRAPRAAGWGQAATAAAPFFLMKQEGVCPY